MRGSGRQYIGAIMNFIGYYIIGLPVGITLAIKVKWGVLGLWIGMCIGNIVHVSPIGIVIYMTRPDLAFRTSDFTVIWTLV